MIRMIDRKCIVAVDDSGIILKHLRSCLVEHMSIMRSPRGCGRSNI